MCPDGLVAPQRDIWSMGVPLKDAPYEFAPDDLRAIWDMPQVPWLVPHIGELFLGLVKNTEAARDPRYSEWTQQIQESKHRVSAQIDANSEMADRLLSGIRDGRYIAYGYAKPRNVKDCRVRIPIDVFEQKYIDWENSSITGSGLEFVSVLIFESGLTGQIDAELARERSIAADHRQHGPESLSSIIEKAVQSLIDDGLLPNSKLQKVNIGLVRARACELYPGQFPNNRGLSNESIRIILTKLIPRTPK